MSLEDLEFALSQLEGSAAVVVRGGEDGAGPEEQRHHGDVAGAGRQVEGRVAQPVSQVGVSSVP